MKAISGITDPEVLVNTYWTNIGELVRVQNYVALSRRGSSRRLTCHTLVAIHPGHQPLDAAPASSEIDGWRTRGTRLRKRPVFIDDLPSRLLPNDPGWFYLEGFGSLVALPQYDQGEGLNVTVTLFPAGDGVDSAMIPMLHWQAGLFGRGTQNLVLRNQLADALAALDRELRAVGEIQRTLLPDALPTIAGFEFAAYYQTSARAAATTMISSLSTAANAGCSSPMSPATARRPRWSWPSRTPLPTHTPTRRRRRRHCLDI